MSVVNPGVMHSRSNCFVALILFDFRLFSPISALSVASWSASVESDKNRLLAISVSFGSGYLRISERFGGSSSNECTVACGSILP